MKKEGTKYQDSTRSFHSGTRSHIESDGCEFDGGNPLRSGELEHVQQYDRY